MYYPSVVYRYSVGQTSYEGERIVFGNRYKSGLEFTPQDVVETYPKYAQVMVHYCPSDPTRSVLEPGADQRTKVMIALGAVMMVAGVLGVLSAVGCCLPF